MSIRQEDSSVWIGYSDFLTTLVILFFVLAVVFAMKSGGARPALLTGQVTSFEEGGPVGDCTVLAGAGTAGGRKQPTDEEGRFALQFSSFWRAVEMEVRADCTGYDPLDTLVRIIPGDTVDLQLELTPVSDDGTITVESLPASLLFETASYTFRDSAAVDTIRQLGLRWKEALGRGEVVAIQGHTDDQPFQPDETMTNWILSGARAARAAEVLTEPRYGVGLDECRVVVMGFGRTRPKREVRPGDSRSEREAKREVNRRIEFRHLRGADLTGQGRPCQ